MSLWHRRPAEPPPKAAGRYTSHSGYRSKRSEAPRREISRAAPPAARATARARSHADAANAPKRIRTVTIRGGVDVPHSGPRAGGAAAATAAVDDAPPAARRGAALARRVVRHAHRGCPEQRPSALAAVPAAGSRARGGRPAACNRDVAPSFAWPLRGQLIAGFGAVANGRHNDGIDIAVPVGTPIRAAADGVVVYTGDELKSYGNLVLLRHSGGFVTAYAHADEILVKVNDMVRRGQVIARSGRTGTVTVPMLHFEIRKGDGPVDPRAYLPPP